jgi:protein-L-isoaspartate O-methyltransferase
MNVVAAADLEKYCAPLREPHVSRELASHAGIPADVAADYVEAICNEAHTALRLLEWAALRPQDRVLEVGAGAGC